MLWPVRALLTDTRTGDRLELRTRQLAEDLQALLHQAEDGQLEALPADASPFRRYESNRG
jgi:hypothetical protein